MTPLVYRSLKILPKEYTATLQKGGTTDLIYSNIAVTLIEQLPCINIKLKK